MLTFVLCKLIDFQAHRDAFIQKKEKSFRFENKILNVEITYPLLIFIVSLLLLLLDVLEVIQILGTAEWRVHFISVVEQAVINFIFPRLFLKGHEGLETVAPQHFAGQVR